MYDQFYGLSGRPFQLTPDPQFYFESATHRKALSYLGYGLAQGEGFIVITGEVGAGKSTLVSHLMQSVDKARLTAATIVTSQLDGLDMVHMAAESFGIDTRGLDKASTLKSIENFLHAEARTGRRCLLIVDEAQNLSVDALEELRMLSNFQLGSSALLQIFLLGQPEFRDLVRDAAELEQLRQRVIATHHLEPMEADEVEPYIIHRLTRAGWTGRPQITADAFSALYAETGGVPRKLNTLMNRVMLMGAVEQVDVLDGGLVGAVIADMAGKPFEYEAPMSARAPLFSDAEGPQVVEADVEPEAEANVEALVEESAPLAAILFQEPEQKVAAPANNSEIEALAARIAALEHRVSDQDAALRRVLAMMIDWMDKEGSFEARYMQNSRAA
jgi:general secretion pathway protein A